jgi:predicted TIM-barrel fold metal-dependent hydrolase
MYAPHGLGPASRLDSFSPSGGPAGSDPAFTAKQLFDEAGVDLALLLPVMTRGMSNGEHESVLCSASNNWLAATWLDQYNHAGRFWGSIRVSAERPDLAVKEIDRWAGHPYFKQVMMAPHTMAPLGNPRYHPIFAAAERHRLPLAIHVNRWHAMYLMTPVGFSSYFLEHQVGYPLLYMPHLLSLLAEGVFEKFPDFKVTLVEGGFTWAPPALWRLDNLWTRHRSEMPLVRRPPSEYVRDHVRFTTQPMDEPLSKTHLARALDLLDAEHTLMFSTDYPHYDFDDPTRILRKVPAAIRRRVACDNAIEWFDLPASRLQEAGEPPRAASSVVGANG